MTEWLVTTLLASSALMALVLAIRDPVRARFGAGVTYALWLLPAARMVLPSFTTTVEHRVAAGPPMAFTVTAAPVGGVAIQPGLIETAGGWPAILLALWLAGALTMLARGLAIYRAQRGSILASAVPLMRLGTIGIVRSEGIGGPVAFGLIDRVIALPFDFEQRFSERQRSLALDHELAHHRSGDLAANVIAFVLLCLQWFNPLAWAAHAAFRFDQEAACDARVLDKADGRDRASYGEAIAKAASGRTLLFAGALDRPSTLSRRLTIMTRTTTTNSRRFGFLLLGGGLLLGLPLTASYAIKHVDIAVPPVAVVPVTPAAAVTPTTPLSQSVRPVQAPQPMQPVQAVVAAAAAAKVAVLAPVAATVTVGPRDIDFIGNDSVRINGVTKRWEELTPAERARIRTETARARQQINQQMARLPQELAQARREMEKFRNGDFQREMAQARAEIERSMAEIDAQSADLRRNGVDPERIKADLRRSLADVRRVDVDKVVRESMASVDPDKIRAQVQQAASSLDRIEVKLDQLDGRQ